MGVETMGLFTRKQRDFAEAVSRLAYCNPFLSERIEYEREALGADFSEKQAVWNILPGLEFNQPNVLEINRRLKDLVDALAAKLRKGTSASDDELLLYEDLVLFLLYHRFLGHFLGVSSELTGPGLKGKRIRFFKNFHDDAMGYFSLDAIRLPAADELHHIFACFFQIRRAFFQIFNNIIGASAPVVRLRAMVWQSIFTHNMRRYRRALYDRMGDITTLITGPSGTGKELVARAIGLARYIPFDPETTKFNEDLAEDFLPLNLSALSPTLIESELFGHRRGSFTGAISDRQGWLEVCPPMGTVFLDEIGDLDPTIQVKLLRVLQDRKYQRLGESKDRIFKGKIIAATNRDLAKDMQEGRFRADLYYRLCSDLIVTPSLHDGVKDTDEELHNLVIFLTKRLVGDEGPDLAAEVLAWIDKNLGRGYPWPGNIRELEQCVTNVLIRKEYRPAALRSKGASGGLANDVLAGTLRKPPAGWASTAAP
jgi:hypothetical protein